LLKFTKAGFIYYHTNTYKQKYRNYFFCLKKKLKNIKNFLRSSKIDFSSRFIISKVYDIVCPNKYGRTTDALSEKIDVVTDHVITWKIAMDHFAPWIILPRSPLRQWWGFVITGSWTQSFSLSKCLLNVNIEVCWVQNNVNVIMTQA